MNKFDKLLDEMNIDELEIFEKDLKEGIIQKYIERKKEFLRLKDKACANCQNKVDDDCYVLIFGELSLRKKAYFCGIDCLQYFISKSIKQKNKKIKKESHILG